MIERTANIHSSGGAQTCKGCIHFFVSYDSKFPYGCRAMGFKGRNYPYREVHLASGDLCQLRQPRSGDGD